jgi:hypothetical protein
MRTWSVVATLCLLSGAARAGVVLVQRTTADKATSTVWLEGDKLRIEQTDPPGTKAIIFDAARRVFVGIDNAKRSYIEISQEQLQQIRAQMEQMMARMPPEQRAAMARQMPTAAAPLAEPKAVALGRKRTVNGFECEDYRLERDGKTIGEACVIPWKAAKVSESDLRALRGLRALTSSMPGMPEAHEVDAAAYPGLPASGRTIDPATGQPIREHVLVSVKREAVAAERFAAPAGFAREEMRGPPRR